ncbi:MAG: hypothetical protein ACM3PU_09715, partial [Gemmatimonadota bacterium]
MAGSDPAPAGLCERRRNKLSLMSTEKIPRTCPRPGATDAANRFHAESAARLQAQPLAALDAQLHQWVGEAE